MGSRKGERRRGGLEACTSTCPREGPWNGSKLVATQGLELFAHYQCGVTGGKCAGSRMGDRSRGGPVLKGGFARLAPKSDASRGWQDYIQGVACMEEQQDRQARHGRNDREEKRRYVETGGETQVWFQGTMPRRVEGHSHESGRRLVRHSVGWPRSQVRMRIGCQRDNEELYFRARSVSSSYRVVGTQWVGISHE